MVLLEAMSGSQGCAALQNTICFFPAQKHLLASKCKTKAFTPTIPALLGCFAVWALITYELIVKDMKGTLLLSVWHRFPSSLFAWVVLYIVFGPLFACVLCAGQLARSQQEGAWVNGTSSLVPRLTKVVLLVAVASACFLLLSVGIAFGLRGRT